MNSEEWDAYLFLDQYKINFNMNGSCISYLKIHNNKLPSANDLDTSWYFKLKYEKSGKTWVEYLLLFT